jgi:hypothetical protein
MTSSVRSAELSGSKCFGLQETRGSLVADRLTQWRKGVEMVEGILGRLHASLLGMLGMERGYG